MKLLSRLTVVFLACGISLYAGVPSFSGIVIFGDNFSDVGNFANKTAAAYSGVRFPSPVFGSSDNYQYNYTDGRFTDGTDTTPPENAYARSGVWHEQLFLLPPAKASLDGGTDYAYGAATTQDGTQVVTVGSLSVTIENMGQQVADYLARGTAPDPNALHIVWGGTNDIARDSSSANVIATAARVTNLVEQLARAGVAYVMVPNIPPLGDLPNYAGRGDLNTASAGYRDELNADLDELQSKLAAANITLYLYRPDVYSLYLQIIMNPGKYGFLDVTHAAQGRAGVDPQYYLFWDGVNPTTAGHEWIAYTAVQTLLVGPKLVGPATVTRVVNAASLSGAFSPGSWVTIFGTNLSQTTRTWGEADFKNDALPTALDGVSVTINNKPAYVYYISPTQLNVLAPMDATTGIAQITVTNANGTATGQASEMSEASAFFQFAPQMSKYIAAVYPDYEYAGPPGLFGKASASRPAKPGEIIQLYATGLGLTSPPYPDGQIGHTKYLLALTPTVLIGGQSAMVQYAGLVSPGLYQLNVVIPAVAPGDQSVVIQVGSGRPSQANKSYLSISN